VRRIGFPKISIFYLWKETEMAKSRANPHISDPKVLIGLSVFLMLIGIMAMNPAAGFICFALAGILLLIAGLKGKRWTRYIAFFLLIISIVLTVIAYFATSEHLKAYRSKAVTRGAK
jgi:energy-coupling factor transporter transmembrane protein EcfT